MLIDNVNHPRHYQHGKFETIEEIRMIFGDERTADFCLMNAYKYKARMSYKGHPEEDLKKADWYFEKYQELTGA